MAGRIVYTAVYTSPTTAYAETKVQQKDVKMTAAKVARGMNFAQNVQKAFSSSGHIFNVTVADQILYLTVSTDNFQRRICFSFLESIRDEFAYKYKGDPQYAREYAKFLEQEQGFFSSNPEADKIRGLQEQVDQVKGIMLENIEKAIERGQKIEEIDDKADQLQQNSLVFKKKSEKLRCALCKKNAKMTAILIACVLVLAIIIIVPIVIHFS